MKYSINAAAHTHIGRVRVNNEDNVYLCGQYRRDISREEFQTEYSGGTSRFLAAVCDGMGGEENGELASLLAVQCLSSCKFEHVYRTANACIQQANQNICAEMKKNGGRRMGSTLAALYIDKDRAIACNLGDSRVSLLRGGRLFQLSTDHNKARQLVELGVLTPEQAKKHSSRHELTQHLGIFEHEMVIQPAFSEEIRLSVGDCFLLCSDGLTDMVSEDEITNQLSTDAAPQQKAGMLVQMALDAGGRDNITVVVIQIEEKKRSFWTSLLG